MNLRVYGQTFESGSDAAGQTQPAKLVVEDLVALERGRRIVGDLYAGRLAVKDAVVSQHRVTLVADEHARLRVPEDVVLLKDTCVGTVTMCVQGGIMYYSNNVCGRCCNVQLIPNIVYVLCSYTIPNKERWIDWLVG